MKATAISKPKLAKKTILATTLWHPKSLDNVIPFIFLVLESNNLTAIKQLYRNNEFFFFTITADIALKILDQVVSSDFSNHFYLNIIECLKVNDK